MKNHKIIIIVAAFLWASSAQAAKPVPVESQAQILGVWNLYAEAPAMHKEKKPVKIKWDFKKDGRLHTTGNDPRTGGAFSVIVDYVVEDEVIKKQIQPGAAKMETCRAYKAEVKEMVLKCKYLYFFLKR